MNAPLRVNEALLIADSAFKPLQCIAWSMQEGGRDLSLTVIDRTNAEAVDRCRLSREQFTDPRKLEAALTHARQSLAADGFKLAPWSMPQ